MTHEFGYWLHGKYVCNHCKVPQDRTGEDCVTFDDDAYTRGKIDGLEAAANIVAELDDAGDVHTRSDYAHVEHILRDEADKLKGE